MPAYTFIDSHCTLWIRSPFLAFGDFPISAEEENAALEAYLIPTRQWTLELPSSSRILNWLVTSITLTPTYLQQPPILQPTYLITSHSQLHKYRLSTIHI